MFMNYMDFTDDGCMNIYTNGQRLRGRAIFAQGGPRAGFIDNYFMIQAPGGTINCLGTISLTNSNCLPPAWQVVSGPANISSGQGTNQVILQASGNGNVVLRATAGNYISEVTISVTVGVPPTPTIQYVTYYGNEVGLKALYIPNASYNWYEDGVLTEAGASNTYITFVACNVPKSISVEAVNACGTSRKAFKGVSVKCSGAGQYTLSSNPANSNLTIAVSEDKTADASTAQIQEVRIRDNSGYLKTTAKYPKGTKQVNINTSSFKEGIYIIQIFNGRQWSNQQLLIQH